MQDQDRTKRQLLEELGELRKRVAVLEAAAIECQQSQEELRCSAAKWQSVAENAPLFVAVVDRVGRLQFLNRFRPGFSPETVFGRPIYEFIQPEFHALARECLEHVFQTGEGRSFESVGAGSAGSPADYVTDVAPVRVDGEIIAATLMARDISAQKQAAVVLQKTHDDLERRVAERTAELTHANKELAIFRKFAESSGEGFGMSDFEGYIVYANPALSQLFGESGPADMIGKKVVTYYAPEYSQRRMNELIPALLREGRWHVEQPILPRQGPPLQTLQSTFLIRDENGKPLRIAVVISDITARRQAEEALRLSEEKYRLLIDACPDAVVMADPQMRMVFASPQAVQLYGAASAAEMCGRSLLDFVVPEDRPRVIAGTARFFQQGLFRNSEYTFLRKDGTRFPCELSSALVKNDQDQPVAVISIVRDITERKQAQEALQRERQSLWQMLQASDHERQLISYDIHDGLAQYLAAAGMQLQVFAGLRDDNPEQAQQAFDAALQLVRQSHAEARRLISEVRPPVIDEIGLETALSHLVHEQRRQGGPKIEFDSDVQFDRLPAILENALYRITQEGLTNAWKHSQSKKIKVSLTQEGAELRLEIRDWGIGFAPDAVKKGHFGLEGVRQRVRLLGGRLTIESQSGLGTHMQVVVPLLEELDNE